MRFFRQECWSGLLFPYPGDLPDPGIEPGSSALQVNSSIAGGFFTNWATREALPLRFISLLIFWYISFRTYCLFLKWDHTIHNCIFSQWYMSQTFSHNIDTSWHVFFSFLIYWRIIALQNFVVFCQTSTWISHRYTYYLLPSEPPSHLFPHPTPLAYVIFCCTEAP